MTDEEVSSGSIHPILLKLSSKNYFSCDTSKDTRSKDTTNSFIITLNHKIPTFNYPDKDSCRKYCW